MLDKFVEDMKTEWEGLSLGEKVAFAFITNGIFWLGLLILILLIKFLFYSPVAFILITGAIGFIISTIYIIDKSEKEERRKRDERYEKTGRW